jgi:hypothetical protein
MVLKQQEHQQQAHQQECFQIIGNLKIKSSKTLIGNKTRLVIA